MTEMFNESQLISELDRIGDSLKRRKRWRRRTPAMAACLTDHIWTMEELMIYRTPRK